MPGHRRAGWTQRRTEEYARARIGIISTSGEDLSSGAVITHTGSGTCLNACIMRGDDWWEYTQTEESCEKKEARDRWLSPALEGI